VQLAGNEGGGPGSVRLASAAGRWALAVAVLGEAMVLLEATVVNVALPSIGRDLRADVAGLQWTLDGYVLTLAALVLAAGSLSDIYGRRGVFTLGTAVFVAASALCAAAPDDPAADCRPVRSRGWRGSSHPWEPCHHRSFIPMTASGRSARGA
jgi:MFS family permease